MCYTLECNYNGGTFTNQVFAFSHAISDFPVDAFETDIVINGVDLPPQQDTKPYTVDTFN